MGSIPRFFVKRWKDIILSLIIVVILVIVLGPRAYHGLALSRRSQMLYIQRDLKNARDESMRKLLFDLSGIELKMAVETVDRPREFFEFDLRQRIRNAGFDPVWRDNRYVLRDISSGNESDPLLSKRGIEFRLGEQFEIQRRRHEKGKMKREGMMSFNVYTYESPSHLLPEMYYYHLNDFHLVLRGGQSVYAKNIQADEQELTLDAAFIMHQTMMYNVNEGTPLTRYIEMSEALLKERGFIMKRRGDAYFPVTLETGTVPELPPKSIFVDAALNELNCQDPVTKYVAKTTLDMYGVEIVWDEAEKRYEIVR
jgi:hypothetical protein